jgi:hypothetical protein
MFRPISRLGTVFQVGSAVAAGEQGSHSPQFPYRVEQRLSAAIRTNLRQSLATIRTNGRAGCPLRV